MSLRFGDVEILRYSVHGWDRLDLSTKIYLYYLSEATLAGRDILYEQHHKLALPMRLLLEEIYERSDVSDDPGERAALLDYLRRFWFCSGFHHHYSEQKLVPAFSCEYFTLSYDRLPYRLRADLRTLGLTREAAVSILFDPDDSPLRRAGGDPATLLERSSVNFYDSSVTTAEALEYYRRLPSRPTAGLNTRLERGDDGQLCERPACLGGMHTAAIRAIITALRSACSYAPTSEARALLTLLSEYYETGDLRKYEQFNIRWVGYHDPEGVDYINGFVETYTDPLGLKGSWEGIVQLKDEQGSARSRIIAESAQLMEQLSPIEERFKRADVPDISASSMQVVMLGGDSYPASPLGVNLPNDESLRASYGSKSVSLANISSAVDAARLESGLVQEFYPIAEVQERILRYGSLVDQVHTDLHECLGHGSGKLLEGVTGEDLREYASALEEARADLCALYHIANPFWVEKGVLPSLDAYKAMYDRYLTNGYLIQLARLPQGSPLTQAHMQCRSLISRYLLSLPGASAILEILRCDRGRYVCIHDYSALRTLIGTLLCEVQRIKSTGDYHAARRLILSYATDVDPDLWFEAKRRFDALGIAPFVGFLNPRLTPRYRSDGTIDDVEISYDEDYDAQMMRYGQEYAYLLGRSRRSSPWEDVLLAIRTRLQRGMDGVVAHSMRTKGSDYPLNYGLHIPRLREIASTLSPNADLAEYLYGHSTRELKILATLLYPPGELTMETALRWIDECQSVELLEQLSCNLLAPLPWVEELLLRLLRHSVTSRTSICKAMPYILVARMVTIARGGCELFPLLLKQASEDLSSGDTLLLLYIDRCLKRLAERDHYSFSLVRAWLVDQQRKEKPSALLSQLEEHLDYLCCERGYPQA